MIYLQFHVSVHPLFEYNKQKVQGNAKQCKRDYSLGLQPIIFLKHFVEKCQRVCPIGENNKINEIEPWP